MSDAPRPTLEIVSDLAPFFFTYQGKIWNLLFVKSFDPVSDEKWVMEMSDGRTMMLTDKRDIQRVKDICITHQTGGGKALIV